VSLPELSGIDLREALTHRGVKTASPEALRALSAEARARSVVVVQDAFTSHYDTSVVVDWCELLIALGFMPWLAPFRPNGKPQHVLGLLGTFERTAEANARMLEALAATGVALVGVDPSMTLAYRAEYVKALGADRVPAVLLPQEWLARRIDDLPTLEADASNPWGLLPHCTEKTNAPAATADWKKVAERLGIVLQTVPSGCCGMAGLYGHERANRATSQAIYALSWRHIVAEPRHAGRLVATGYSCRCQAALVDGVDLPHPIQVLLARVRASLDAPVEPPVEPPKPPVAALAPQHHDQA
jgi:Fe-S oxidoreductase